MRAILLTALLALLLALAGCGNGESDPGGGNGAAGVGENPDAAVPSDGGGDEPASDADVQGGVGEDGESAAVAPATQGSSDKRGPVLGCIRESGLRAEMRGENELQVGDPGSGPRVEFFLSSGQAEAKQFEGKAQGAELIGPALLYVNQGSDATLEKIENCLQEN